MRVHLYNNGEVWKQVPDWPWYKVSNIGQVMRVVPGRGTRAGFILKPTGGLYPTVALRRAGGESKVFKTAVLVLLAFVGPRPEGQECCHNDDDKKNSCLDNLRWDTHKANGQDALKNGLMWVGEKSLKAVLTDGEVRRIREEYVPGRRGPGVYPGSLAYLSEKYGINRKSISNVVNHRFWKHVK